MKRFSLTLSILLLGIITIIAGNNKNLPTICPEPIRCYISDDYFPLKKITIACEDKKAVDWARRHLREWYGRFSPTAESAKAKTSDMGEEAYELSIAKEVKVKAKTIKGVRHALYSLRQLAIPRRGTLKVEGWIVPKAEIEDEPDMKFRGIHICWFHENTPQEIERFIRLAAYYKLNYAVIESWGTFRSESAPWLGWQDGTMTKQEIKRLKAIADDLGITLIPQMNIFGHATMARHCAGKHATLDLNPDYQPLFEPFAGWNWCLSNPETLKLQQSLIGELHEAFGNPPYFHIGCDEANYPSCPECTKQPYSKLFVGHIKEINKTLSKRGARPMMWHDMLLDNKDSRWIGFYANGDSELVKAVKDLPRNIIVCDWYYGDKKESYPTLDYFKQSGFDVLTCPWDNVGGIIAQGKYAHSHGINGILGTLWHHHTGNTMADIFFNLANIAWNSNSSMKVNSPEGGNSNSKDYLVHTHLRQMAWDMNITDSRLTGVYKDEIPTASAPNN